MISYPMTDPFIYIYIIYMRYIYLLIYHRNQLNVGKYTIHGSHGEEFGAVSDENET